MNKAKALLDSLMGPSRNLSAKERSGEDFKRSDVCKNYLAGFCPEAHLSFVEIDRGKVEISPPVPCPKLHSVAMREELEKHPKAEKYKREYEDALKTRLEDIATEALARAAVERRRCRPKEAAAVPEDKKLRLDAMEEERKRMTAEAEEKEKAGDVAGSLEAKRLAQRCQAHIAQLEQNLPQGFPGEDVCKYCGFRFIIGGPKTARASEHLGEGAAAWEEEHVNTKCHRGFVEIHERLERLRESIRRRGEGEADKEVVESTRSRRESERDKGDAEGTRSRRDSEPDKGDTGRRAARSRSRKARGRSRSREARGRSRSRGRGRREGGRQNGGREGRRRSRSRSREAKAGGR